MTKQLTPHYWEKSKLHLSKKDKTLSRIIKSYQGEALVGKSDAYHTLARSIVGQQISVKAADSIWAKFEGLSKIEPKKVLKLSDEKLRAIGLSGQKVSYIRNVSEFAIGHDGNWHDDDEEVIKELCKIKGIGRWTAEMFLIFHLQRPDILPIADIGLLKACEKHYGVERKEVAKLAENWRPYRSVATWYLWRSLDPVPVAY